MTLRDRSRDVFEAIPGVALAKEAPLPAVDDYEDLERHGFVRLNPKSRAIIARALQVLGYPAFHATLARSAEKLLRSTNMREDKVFGPAYSATVALEDDPRQLSAVERAATMAFAARSFCDDTMSGRLSPDEHRGEPLEMGQYPNLFSTSIVVDGKRTRLFKSTSFERLAVVVRRRIFTLEVTSTDSAADIASALTRIVERSEKGAAVADADAPGALSAGDSKAVIHGIQEMEHSPENARSLAALRDCFVVLCLDLETEPATSADVAFATHAANPANRWYLASLQIVVFGNAKVGGICSFPAYLDGNVMMRAAAELQARAAAADLSSVAESPPRAAIELAWKLPKRWVELAWRDVRSIQTSEQATFELPLGRGAFTKVDPVNAFVAALAVATMRTAGELPNILQLVTVSRFRCMPVGGAVMTTPALRAFVDAMTDRQISAERRAELLSACLATLAAETRAERKRLSLRWAIEGFLRTRKGRFATGAVLLSTVAALKAAGGLTRDRIILSHPETRPEVALLGRPGVRLPYVSHYGLHYQIFADRTVMTFMPGAKWKVPNATLSHALEAALREVVALAEA